MKNIFKFEQYYIDEYYKQKDLKKYCDITCIYQPQNKSDLDNYYISLRNLDYRIKIFSSTTYKLPENIKNDLVWGIYYYELMQKINTQHTSSNIFGIINLEVGLTTNSDNPKIISQLENTLALSMTEYLKLVLEYRDIRDIAPTINQSLRDRYNQEIIIGWNSFNKMLKNLAGMIEDLINLKYDDINKSTAYAQYFAMQLLIHVIKLREQQPQRTTTKLAAISQLQSGKKFAKIRRDCKKETYPKTIDGAIKFIGDNYVSWYETWKAYKKKPEQHKVQYSEIPAHFKAWFKNIEKLARPTREKSINYYWSVNKNTTANPFINNFLK